MKTKQTKKSLIEHLRKIPIVQLACEKSNVSRACYYKWRAADPDFAKQADEALDDGIASLNDLSEAQLIAMIKDQNIMAIQFWLRARHKAYSNKVELSGKIKHEVDAWTPETEAAINKVIQLAQGIIPDQPLNDLALNTATEQTSEENKINNSENISEQPTPPVGIK